MAETKKLFNETLKEVEQEYKPIGEIGMAILKASATSRDVIKELIEAHTEKERQQVEIQLFYEFIYFYMHMTMRHAFVHLDESTIEKIQSYLGPLIASVAIDSYFAHWPKELKERMTNEFYDKLNEAELEYTSCTQFDPAEQVGQEMTKKLLALFIQLGSNISALFGKGGMDMAVVKPIVQVAIDEWKGMQLDKLITEVK